MASGNMAVNINISKIMLDSSSASKATDDKVVNQNSFKDAIKNKSDKLNKKADSKTDKSDKTDKTDSQDKLNGNTENQKDEVKETSQGLDMAQAQMLYGSFLINNKDFSVFVNATANNAPEMAQQTVKAQSASQVPFVQKLSAETVQNSTVQQNTVSAADTNKTATQLNLSNDQVVKNTDFINSIADLNQMLSNENLQNTVDNQVTALNQMLADTGLSNLKTYGEKTVNVLKDIVVEQYTKSDKESEKNITTGFETALQTVQSTSKGDVIQVKVADALPLNNTEAMDNLADKIIVHGNNEFDLQLEPEDLGKIHVKLTFENGETKVSILCSTQKALETLNGSTDKLAAILENRTGNTTFVQVNQSDEQTYRQDYQQQNGREQNYQGDERKDKRDKNEKSTDFLDQMRLGLV